MGTVVVRPRRLPKLTQLAKSHEQTPVEYVAAVLAKHPTFAEAATEMGVSRPTLRRWMADLEITVKSA